MLSLIHIYVTEKASRDCSHQKGTDAAQSQQTEEVAHGALGSHPAQDHHRGQHHQQAIAHVRHHDAVKQDKEGGHQGVWVHASVGRQGVHLRDCLLYTSRCV